MRNVAKTAFRAVLKRYSRYLSANGVFIAQLWNSAKYSAILKLIAKNFNILEQHQPEGSKTMLLVFR